MHEKEYKITFLAAHGLVLCKLYLSLRAPQTSSAKSPPTLSEQKGVDHSPGPDPLHRIFDVKCSCDHVHVENPYTYIRCSPAINFDLNHRISYAQVKITEHNIR